jgi:MoxR-like ATPase
MSMGYVKTLEQECEILRRRNMWQQDDPLNLIEPVTSNEEFFELQRFAEKEIYVDDQIIEYISKIVRSTRMHPLIEIGSSPRGGLALLKVSKAYAAILGRDFVTPDDVKTFTVDALGHRVIMKAEYDLEVKGGPREIIEEIVKLIEVPKQFQRR